MNTKRKKTGRKLLSFLLTLAMLVGLMPGMSLSVYADDDIYNPASSYNYSTFTSKNNNTEFTIKQVPGYTWYVIGYDSSAKTVTLLSKQSFGNHKFDGGHWKGDYDYIYYNTYDDSDIKSYVEGLPGENQPLAGISSAMVGVPYLIDKTTADGLSKTKLKGDTSTYSSGYWWLSSPSPFRTDEAYGVYNSGYINDACPVLNKHGVRPALKLDLSKVVFKDSTKTFGLKRTYKALDESTRPVINVKRGGNAVTSGAPQIGDVLTAESDATDLEYEWYRGSDKIDSATESTYTLTTDDLGKAITVIVYQTKDEIGDDLTNRPTQTSEATAAVEKKTNPNAKITVDGLAGIIEKTENSITIGSTSSDYEYAVVTGGAATPYNWTDPAPRTGDGGALTFDGLSAGTDYDVYVRAKGSDDTQSGEETMITVSTNVTVTIEDTPAQGKGVNVTLTPSKQGVTYKWYIGDNAEPEGTGTKVVPRVGGNTLKIEVYAGSPAAIIGTVTSANIMTLADVISASSESPVSITLDGPVTGGISIPEGKAVLLDIKGQEVDGGISVQSGATLTIKDTSNPQTGTVKGTVTASDTGTVIIKGGRYENTPDGTGTKTIHGGLFKYDPTTLLNTPYEVKESGVDGYPHEVYNAYVELKEENKPVISITKANDNTDKNPQVGDTLTATTDAHPVSYQWYRGNQRRDRKRIHDYKGRPRESNYRHGYTGKGCGRQQSDDGAYTDL